MTRLLSTTPLVLFALVALSSFCSGLGFTPPVVRAKTSLRQKRTVLSMGWFDFKPMHGSGSGKDVLDEQWEAQQAILEARRSGHIDKEHLKEKYKGGNVNDLGNLMKEREEAYTHHVEEDTLPAAKTGKPKMKFFWEK